MLTVKTNGYNTVRVRECNACGDVLMDTEIINGKEYNIYLGYCGYVSYYAVEKNKKILKKSIDKQLKIWYNKYRN